MGKRKRFTEWRVNLIDRFGDCIHINGIYGRADGGKRAAEKCYATTVVPWEISEGEIGVALVLERSVRTWDDAEYGGNADLLDDELTVFAARGDADALAVGGWEVDAEV